VFNPLDHAGMPLERQSRDWRELRMGGLDPEDVGSHTSCRVLVMRGVENHAVEYDGWAWRSEPDPDLRGQLGRLRSAEARQRRTLAGLLRPPGGVLEAALAYERAAIDLDSWLARIEPDAGRRKVYQCDALEDFDHAYRYADVVDLVRRRRAGWMVDEVDDVIPARFETGQPEPGYEGAAESATPAPLSELNALTMLAVERHMTAFYDNAGPGRVHPFARPVYREVSRVEHDQVLRHQVLVDTGTGRWEQLVIREYNECRLYHAFLEHESDPRVRAVWELNLQMELGQLRLACDLLRRFDGREPGEFLGTGVPEASGFDRNKEFLRQLLGTHLDPETLGSGPIRDVPQVREVRGRLDSAGRPGVVTDVLDVLANQHTRIEALFYDIEVATDERRRTAFDELVRLVAAHETLEEEAVHPLARDWLPGGFEVIRDLVEEERQTKRMLIELVDVGVDSADFEDRLVILRDAVLSHARHEERSEFRQLRERVPAERLRELAGSLAGTPRITPGG
jgi:hypothetical protein